MGGTIAEQDRADRLVRTRENLAKLLAGLQVPLSIGVPLGAADEPYRELLGDSGFGWRNADDFENWLTEVFR
jgi:hypothetical protein